MLVFVRSLLTLAAVAAVELPNVQRRISTATRWLQSTTVADTGKVIYVNPDAPSDQPDYGDLANACKTLQHAVNLAQAGDTVQALPGTYATGGKPLLLGAKDITLQGNDTLIDCEGQGRGIVINHTVTVRGVTVFNCRADSDSAGNNVPSGHGGGISVIGGSATLQDVQVSNCTADRGGAGVLITGRAAPSFTACRVTDNTVLAGDGGGVKIAKGSTPHFSLTHITGNRALSKEDNIVDGGGGGVWVADENTAPVFESCVISHNTAQYGGGAVIASNSSTQFIGTNITDNNATAGGGGAWIQTGASPRFTDTQITGNNAQGSSSTIGQGGGLFVSSNHTDPVFKSCVISNNTASTGGGAYIQLGSKPQFIGTNITDNQARSNNDNGGGGGLCIRDNGTDPVFKGCVISGNMAPWAGGGAWIDSGASPQFISTNITSNKALGVDGSGGGGGGLYITDVDTAGLFEGCVINNNAATGGGGAWILGGASPHFTDTTITGNSAVSNNTNGGGGGLLLSDNGTYPVFESCVISNNTAPYGGGGAWIWNGARPQFNVTNITDNRSPGNAGNGGGLEITSSLTAPVFKSCVISGNTAPWAGGGAWIDGGASPQFIDTHITGNRADGKSGSGGGLLVSDNHTNPMFKSCVVSGNTAPYGGGGAWIMSGASSNFTDTQITNNHSPGKDGQGGGLFVLEDYTDPVFTGCSISHNTAQNGGGGAWIQVGARPQFISTNLTSNVGSEGGGAYITTGASPQFTDTHITSNQALGEYGGGGLYITDRNTAPMFKGCVINKNTAAEGGGGAWIQNGARPSFDSCTLDHNSAEMGGAVYLTSGKLGQMDHRVLASFTACGMSNNKALGPGDCPHRVVPQGQGGAMYIDAPAAVQLNETHISNNSACWGGGIYIDAVSSEFVGSCQFGVCPHWTGTATGNTAEVTGGGIFLFVGSGSATTPTPTPAPTAPTPSPSPSPSPSPTPTALLYDISASVLPNTMHFRHNSIPESGKGYGPQKASNPIRFIPVGNSVTKLAPEQSHPIQLYLHDLFSQKCTGAIATGFLQFGMISSTDNEPYAPNNRTITLCPLYDGVSNDCSFTYNKAILNQPFDINVLATATSHLKHIPQLGIGPFRVGECTDGKEQCACGPHTSCGCTEVGMFTCITHTSGRLSQQDIAGIIVSLALAVIFGALGLWAYRLKVKLAEANRQLDLRVDDLHEELSSQGMEIAYLRDWR